MEVEIIIPAHNCASACLRMLLNLMEQTSEANAEAPEIGVCVVDDASTDETAETIERFVDAVRRSGITGWRFVRRKKRGNAGGARNVGVEGSTAARVAFFDADDDIAEGALRRLLRAFAEAPDADCHMWGFTRLTKDGTTTWLPDFADSQIGYATAPVGPWIKAIRREKFVPFPEGVYCEDCVRDYDTSKTVMRPTADDYRQMGYLPYSDKFPEEPAPEGKHYIPSGWETVADTMVRRTYVLVDDQPPPPRTFSRFQLYLCLAPMGLWEPLMAWLATKTYNSIKADVAFNQAQEFKEDHPLFRQWLGEAQAALEVDDATVEQILAASVKVED